MEAEESVRNVEKDMIIDYNQVHRFDGPFCTVQGHHQSSCPFIGAGMRAEK